MKALHTNVSTTAEEVDMPGLWLGRPSPDTPMGNVHTSYRIAGLFNILGSRLASRHITPHRSHTLFMSVSFLPTKYIYQCAKRKFTPVIQFTPVIMFSSFRNEILSPVTMLPSILTFPQTYSNIASFHPPPPATHLPSPHPTAPSDENRTRFPIYNAASHQEFC